MSNILRQKFIENYNMEMVAVELMNLIEEIDMTEEVLENFINTNKHIDTSVSPTF